MTNPPTSELSSYYSAQESQIVSTCRVSPHTPQEIAKILGILKQDGAQFSVRSGGHMTWPGAANIAAPGVAIDLKALNITTVSADKKTAHVQPGGGWGVVYNTLEPLDLIVVGGRSMTVAPGGFLLGGGISFFSPEHGFASDNIVNYEVVTADGQVTNANQTFNSDLYWGLRTYPHTNMWGGFRTFNLSYARVAGEGFVDMMDKMENNTFASGSYNLGSANTVELSFSYTSPELDGADVFNEPLSIPFLTDTTRGNVDIQNLISEIDAAFPIGARAAFYTIAFTPDVQFMLDMWQQGLQIFSAYAGNPVLNWGLSFQPFSTPQLKQIQEHNGPQNLSTSTGPFILVNLNAFWTDSSLDSDINSKLEQLIDWSKAQLQAKGIWIPWIYLNYAPPTVHPYTTFGTQNLQKLKAIRQKYDSGNVFEKLWPGGFKL
ncbi:hypothetical protein B0H14DRAFT_3657729 [Mycena olivaceomarginata]|nr:hypothetical protein B0H14DRAFT_3657729 [Mycena olivaceomarginata]